MPTIGVISDTHGLLRPEAVSALHSSELIIHAGDVGSPEILYELERIARVRAVRGNVDKGDWATRLPVSDAIEWRGVSIYVVHDIAELDLDPKQAGFAAVVSGHTHVPESAKRDGVLFLNPGSAGPGRFKLPCNGCTITF